MRGEITLSIITPVYNGSSDLINCLQNVISEMNSDIEHIIIDGGSLDGTLDILKEYSARYNHIRWISEPDKGQSDAMNKGIRLARGHIIGFLNVDDYYEPGVLKRVMVLFHDVPDNTIILGNCVIWDEEGNILDVSRPVGITHDRMLMGQIIQPYPVNPSAYFYHKQLHDIVGGYDVDEHYHMDLDFLFRISKVANLLHFDEHWGNFRYQPGTKTHQNFESGLLNRRIDKLVKRYQNQLPFWKKIWIFPVYVYSRSNLAATVAYFRRHPDELLPRLLNRIRLVFNR